MKRILVIDDEPYIAEVIMRFSDKLGYEADVSYTGDDTLEKFRNSDYWAVFCDLKMPGLNGLELFDRLQNLKRGLVKRFVLLTGSIPDTKMEAMLREKNIIFFRKPFTFEQFTNLFTVLENTA